MIKLKEKVTSLIILIILATLNACKAPSIKNQVRRVYSLKFASCYCQYYDLNKVKKASNLIRCEDFYRVNYPDLPALSNKEYCDDLIGFSLEAWASKITPWGREVMRYGGDACK